MFHSFSQYVPPDLLFVAILLTTSVISALVSGVLARRRALRELAARVPSRVRLDGTHTVRSPDDA